MNKMIVVFVLWFACGILAHGMWMADFTERWPEFAHCHRHSDRFGAMYVTITGPLGLVAMSLLVDHPTHLRYRTLPDEESWAAYSKRWPSLDRESWETC